MSLSHPTPFTTFKGLASVLLVVSSALLSGCMKSSAATQVTYQSDVEVTNQMLKMVNSAFRTKIIGGDWRYQGAQGVNGTINAYIQIPEKLKMSKQAQVQYLQQSLCPAASKQSLWQQIKNVPLSVHVYTMNRKHTVFANCENPYA